MFLWNSKNCRLIAVVRAALRLSSMQRLCGILCWPQDLGHQNRYDASGIIRNECMHACMHAWMNEWMNQQESVQDSSRTRWFWPMNIMNLAHSPSCLQNQPTEDDWPDPFQALNVRTVRRYTIFGPSKWHFPSTQLQSVLRVRHFYTL